MSARIRRGDDWVEITIGNVSTSGLMAKTQSPPVPGELVEIRRRGTSVEGEVVWSTRTRFGLRSHEPIDVESLLAESGIQTRTDVKDPRERRFWHWRKGRD